MYKASRASGSSSSSLSATSYPILREPNAVRLGRLVIDIYDPMLDYVDIFSEKDLLDLEHTPSAIIQNESVHPLSIVERSKKKSIGMILGEFFGSKKTKSTGTKVEVECTKAMYFELSQAPQRFKQGCQDGNVQKWLNEAIISQRNQVYMIVGYHSLVDPTIKENATKDTDTNAAAQPSAIVGLASEVTRISSSALLPKNATPEITSHHSVSLHLQQNIPHVGERIWAIKCCKITLGRFWKKTLAIENASLGISHWEMMWPMVRGQEGLDRDCVISADVEELPEEIEEIEKMFGEDGEEFDVFEDSDEGGEHKFVMRLELEED